MEQHANQLQDQNICFWTMRI